MYDILINSLFAVFTGISNLLYIALFFLLLALCIKRKEAFESIRAAIPNSVFNINILALDLILIAPLLVAISKLLHNANLHVISISSWSNVPAPVTILLAVILGDFIGYWRHRLEHTKFLWPAHVIHHSDTHMTWLTLVRFHPLNRLSTFIIDSSFLLALGLPPYAIIANNLVRHYYGFFIHADIPWTYGKLGYVLVSPVMHRWHHAEEKAAHHTNFATVFAFYDRLFGTYRVPGQCNVRLGVKGKSNKSLLAQLAYPFQPTSYKINDKRLEKIPNNVL